MSKRAVVINYTVTPPPHEGSEQWESDPALWCPACGVKGEIHAFNQGLLSICLACDQRFSLDLTIPAPAYADQRIAALKAKRPKP